MVRLAIVAGLAFIVSGCAGTVSSMVRESDKDPAFSYDGTYIAEVDHRGGRQEMGSGWYSNCGPRKSTDSLKVVASEIFWNWSEDFTVNGFVDANGRFRLEQQSDNDVKGIGLMLSDGGVTVILQGDISADIMKGLLVFGVAQFNQRGCSYPVTYSKQK